MKVFEFEKSLLDRLQESRNLLQMRGNNFIPPSEIRHEWECYAELKMEPAGWQAIWRINRATCEQFNIKYPTVVFGMVNNVQFEELVAEFAVIAVQDDNVHLPEIHEVPLQDLWPTIQQENTELNVERTAEYLDEYRFFYRNVWMPWDDELDEDYDWCEKHLESRIRFCFDLKRKMSRPMADHIRKLLAEARYIADKREIIDLEMAEDESLEDDPMKVSELLRLQLRMVQIRNDIDTFINPALRKAYEMVHFQSTVNSNKTDEPKVFIVTKMDSIPNQINYLETAKSTLSSDQMVELSPSMKDCFKKCAARDHVLLPLGLHTIKFFEPLNSNGYIKAISNVENKESFLDIEKNAVIRCEEDDNVLLTFNGDFTLENVTLDCRNVRLGIWVMGGTLTLKNCYFIGDVASSTCNGIKVASGAGCVLENTSIEHFDTGITCATGGSISFTNSIINGCSIGLDVSNGSTVESFSTEIKNSSKYGVVFTNDIENFLAMNGKKMVVAGLTELEKLTTDSNILKFTGNIVFNSNKDGNILAFDRSGLGKLQHSVYLEDNYDESGFNGEMDTINEEEQTMNISQ